MTQHRTTAEDRPTTGVYWRYAAAGLAYLVATVHLFHPDRGFPRLVRVLAADPGLLVTDPRPVAFVLSGIAIVVGVQLAFLGVLRRPVYVLGMGLMGTYVAGYFAWHFTGHGGFLPNRAPNYHGEGPIEAVISHLSTYPWALVAVVSEVALLVVLVVLYRRDG